MNTLHINTNRVEHDYQHIDHRFDPDDGILWVYLNTYPRPCVTPELVNDIRALQRTLEVNGGKMPAGNMLETVKYHVLDSNVDGVFSLGGDLALFLRCIEAGDRETIGKYAKNCINAIYPIMVNFNLPIVTISLVRGSALGGGFEIALSGDVIIAESSAQMGFPEILFNLFPGMGAYQMLASRIGLGKAHKMITGGKLYSAEELFDMGIVDVLADDGGGEQAVYSYIHHHSKHWNGFMAIQQVLQKLRRYNYDELIDICCNTWVNSVFSLSGRDLKTMSRFVRSQQKYMPVERKIPAALMAASSL